MKAFIIHGAYGHPEENWFQWLKAELEKIDFEVFVPKFPTPEGQSLDSWMKVFSIFEKKLDEETIMIGHSLGPAFILRLLEKIEKPVKSCFFVSGCIDLLGNEEFDKINRTFVEKEFDWDKIKNNCRKFYIIHSDNDPYVPLKMGKKLSDKLDGEMDIVRDGGHFNEGAGYTKFPFLLRKIMEDLL